MQQCCIALANWPTTMPGSRRRGSTPWWAMRAHRVVVGVQQQGCSALAKFVNDNADNQARITAAGGVEALVRAMGAHAGSEGVQHEGCSLQGAGEPRQQQYRQPGQDRGCQGLTDGIDAVVGAMRAHRGVAVVQEMGCAALLCLVWNNADRGGGRDRRPHKRALATKRKLLGGGRIVGKRHFRDVPREAQKLTAANRLFGTVRLREMETR